MTIRDLATLPSKVGRFLLTGLMGDLPTDKEQSRRTLDADELRSWAAPKCKRYWEGYPDRKNDSLIRTFGGAPVSFTAKYDHNCHMTGFRAKTFGFSSVGHPGYGLREATGPSDLEALATLRRHYPGLFNGRDKAVTKEELYWWAKRRVALRNKVLIMSRDGYPVTFANRERSHQQQDESGTLVTWNYTEVIATVRNSKMTLVSGDPAATEDHALVNLVTAFPKLIPTSLNNLKFP